MLLAREEIWFCSSEVHPLENKMQGPMASINSVDLEQRQARSAASQPMLLAAVLRQPRAQSGSWLTMLGRLLVEAVAAAPVVVGFWAAVEAIRTMAAVRVVMICMLGNCCLGLLFVGMAGDHMGQTKDRAESNGGRWKVEDVFKQVEAGRR